MPPPNRKTLSVAELLDRVAQLVAAPWQDKAIALDIGVEPASLSLDADREMLEQVLLNLLKNAEQALDATEIAGKIFVPFFTTRREGSGVGLALTRQVMLAHGGTAVLGSSESGGARFTLSF